MGFLDFLKKRRADSKGVATNGSYDNPYQERVLVTIPVTIDGVVTPIALREVKNKQAKVSGGQGELHYRGEKIPITVSSPTADSFSIGISIGMHKANVPEFKEEVKRLQDEGLITPQCKVSYIPDFKNVMLYRRSESTVGGSVQRWSNIARGQLQPLVDDFIQVMPWIMKLYGE
jgi:hypothetical protein